MVLLLQEVFFLLSYTTVSKLDFINTVSSVDGGQRAVIFDRFKGVRQTVIGEGTHFIIPWVQKPIIYDIRSKPRNIPVMTGSKGQFI